MNDVMNEHNATLLGSITKAVKIIGAQHNGTILRIIRQGLVYHRIRLYHIIRLYHTILSLSGSCLGSR